MIIRTNAAPKKKLIEPKKLEPVVEPAEVKEETVKKPIKEYKVRKKKTEVTFDDQDSLLKEDNNN